MTWDLTPYLAVSLVRNVPIEITLVVGAQSHRLVLNRDVALSTAPTADLCPPPKEGFDRIGSLVSFPCTISTRARLQPSWVRRGTP